MTFHCYYCRRVLVCNSKFKLQERNPHKRLYQKSEQNIICPSCKAEFKITVEVIQPTGLSLDILAEYENKPVK